MSEEDAEPQLPKPDFAGGKYVVAVDPCDGSSNIACNVPVGTIFGVWVIILASSSYFIIHFVKHEVNS